MKPLLLAVLAVGLGAAPAVAADVPPQGSQPLSSIVAKVEQRQDFLAIQSIVYDDDQYEIRYRTVGGQERKIAVNPKSGDETHDED